jgi:hypothetical protein
MDIQINPTNRQKQCFKLLLDDHTNIVVFGGAAGGGKSWLGCMWITTLCLKYPGVRCLIGRTVLATLKQTTLNTLFEVLNLMGLRSGEHFTFNGQSNIVTFNNKSEIILKDLEDRPGDVDKNSLGGIEVSAIFVDEAAQISYMTYSILKSRIRFKLNEYKLIPKMLLTCNPGQNWIKSEFYLPFIQDRLDIDKAFVPSLAKDNPFLPDSYIKLLQDLPQAQRRRLLEGDWDYMSDSDNLYDFDQISSSVFKLTPNPTDKKYISLDVARFGEDRSVAMVWVGLCVVECITYRKLSATDLVNEIKELMMKHGIHPNNVIVDSDGVGGPVADMLRGTNFINNSSPLHNQNFINLKSQCYVKLSDLFKEGKISINILDPMVVDELTQELLTVKLKNQDKDNKVSVQSKDEMKRILGKSPDLSDALMMGMYPHIKNLKSTGRYSIAFIH